MQAKRTIIAILRKTGLISMANRMNNWRYALIKRKAIKKGENPVDAVYDQRFFRQNAKLVDPSVKTVVDSIVERYHPASVIDFGCGSGRYLKEFRDKGVHILGVDGSRHAKENAVIPKESLIIHDLTKPFRQQDYPESPRLLGFELALCFEVAEHIPTEASATLVQSITRHAPVALFTAAPPGQGGTDHINEQRPEFWIGLFAREGFEFKADATASLQEDWRKKGVLWWHTNNIMVFEKKGRGKN